MRNHRVEILGQTYIYRLLTRKELRDITQECDGLAVVFEDLVCEKCVVSYPENFPGLDDCLAGIPTTICETVMAKSGYSDESALSSFEAEAVEWASTPESRIISLICFCMPSMTKDAIESLDPEDFYYYAAMAQLIAKGLYGMDASGFLNPEKEAAMEQRRGSSQRTTNMSTAEQMQFQQMEQLNSVAKPQGKAASISF